MNILMVTEKDAANASLSRIGNAFFRYNHNVRIYAPYFTTDLLKGFDTEIPKFAFNELNDEALDWCDMIFATSIAAAVLKQERILRLKKPIFTHNYLINGQVNWGGDICFVSSIETSWTDYDNVVNYSRFAVGEPKYDGSENSGCENTKKFLFIDSGHFPFGVKGKHELAQTLLSICRAYPDYELIVKPRFLKGDSVITHRNLLTLYDVLLEENEGCLPSNLKYLDEHIDLMDLINQCDVVICLYTTAFVGAYVAGKGLLVIDGLDSEDVYDVRYKTFMRIRENMKYINAIVKYNDINMYLPEGIKADEGRIKKLFAEKDNSAEKIVEVVEKLMKNYYNCGKFPKMQDYEYSNWETIISEESDYSWDNVINKRIRNYILQRMLIHIDFNISRNIDISYIMDYVNDIDFGTVDIDVVLKKVSVIRSECIVLNRDIMIVDDIDAGILLNAYYILKQYKEILNFVKKDISAYYLFNGFVYADYGDDDRSLSNLEKYFEMTEGRCYIKEISDMSGNRFRAFILIISLYDKYNNKVKVNEYVSRMEAYYKINYLVNDIGEEGKSRVQRDYKNFILNYRNN